MCSSRLCIQRIPACDEERHPRDEAMRMPNQHILPRLITCKPFPTSGDLSLLTRGRMGHKRKDWLRMPSSLLGLLLWVQYSGDQKSQTRTVCQTVANANKLGIALGTAPEKKKTSCLCSTCPWYACKQIHYWKYTSAPLDRARIFCLQDCKNTVIHSFQQRKHMSSCISKTRKTQIIISCSLWCQ